MLLDKEEGGKDLEGNSVLESRSVHSWIQQHRPNASSVLVAGYRAVIKAGLDSALVQLVVHEDWHQMSTHTGRYWVTRCDRHFGEKLQSVMRKESGVLGTLAWDWGSQGQFWVGDVWSETVWISQADWWTPNCLIIIYIHRKFLKFSDANFGYSQLWIFTFPLGRYLKHCIWPLLSSIKYNRYFYLPWVQRLA